MRTVLEIADELRSMANMGLLYTSNPYDQHRYFHLLELSAELAQQDLPQPKSSILQAYYHNLTHVTPLVGADALVVQDGKMLLIQRKDSGLWALPGGAIDVGETLAEAATRELFEETGLRGRPVRLMGIFDSRLWDSRGLMHFYQMVVLVEPLGGELKTTLETTGARFFDLHALPELDDGHRKIVPRLLELLQASETHLDPAESTDHREQEKPSNPNRDRSFQATLQRFLVAALFFLQRRGHTAKASPGK